MSYKIEVSDMTSIPRQFRRPLLVARNRLIVPFGFAGMEHMKIKALAVPLLGLSLLVVSCETTTTRTVASNKSKTPPAQHVNTYEGGEMVKRMQQGGGSGVADSQGNFIGGGGR